MSETALPSSAAAPRSLARFRELGLLALAAAVGVLAGAVVTAMSGLTQKLHAVLFGIGGGVRLSEQATLAAPYLALVPVVGGALIGASMLAARRFATRVPVDPIEANALHGGRMSIGESLFVAAQTMISSGFGASVGLEAGYTQASAGFASRIALALKLRRNEVRTLVGCAAAGAIAAAFDAPLTGAFYGFELIIGTYSVALVAPVLAASLAASLTASWLGAVQTPIEIGDVPMMTGTDLLPFLALGLIGGLVAVGIMQLVTLVERLMRTARIPGPARPLLGGAIVGVLGLITPQVLSSGHGALHLELGATTSLAALGALFALKALASAVSLGSGFRGGLFFASLFLGALLGKIFAGLLTVTAIAPEVVPLVAAVVGMASVAVGIVGGPMTMSFLVLETTGDLAITGAVLAASVMSAVVVRETFGYSFSTWRLHLRGETIRSATDVGWMRSLTVAKLLRRDVKTFPADGTLQAFRLAYPLGSAQRAIAVDADGRYAGMIVVADAYAPESERKEPGETVRPLARHEDCMLLPWMNVAEAAKLFEAAKAEELAVVDGMASRKVLGLVTEQHLLRRYAEELDKARRDLAGEG